MILSQILSRILSSRVYGEHVEPTILKNPFLSFSERFLVLIFGCLTLLMCCSCSSTKVATQLVKDVRLDTVYMSNLQYDSIYIDTSHSLEYRLNPLNRLSPLNPDTVVITNVSTEYRYKLLRDTIKVIQRDSIPYEVTVIETKEIKRPLTWYDHFSRAILWLNIGFAIYWLIRLIRKFH